MNQRIVVVSTIATVVVLAILAVVSSISRSRRDIERTGIASKMPSKGAPVEGNPSSPIDESNVGQQEDKPADAPPSQPPARREPRKRDIPVPTEVGSDARKKRSYIAEAGTWDEFYDRAKTADLDQDGLEAMIIDRLTDELKLTKESKATLQQLITTEQDEFAKATIVLHGGAESFEKKLREGKGVKEEVKTARDTFRKGYDQAYYNYFTVDQMAKINEHLRNENIRIIVIHEPELDRYVIRGVGK